MNNKTPSFSNMFYSREYILKTGQLSQRVCALEYVLFILTTVDLSSNSCRISYFLDGISSSSLLLLSDSTEDPPLQPGPVGTSVGCGFLHSLAGPFFFYVMGALLFPVQ